MAITEAQVGHPRAILDEDQVWEIRELYNLKVKRSDVYDLFKYTGITERGFKKIWDGQTWPNIHNEVYTQENREWHKKATGLLLKKRLTKC